VKQVIRESGYNSLQANLTKRTNYVLTTIISYTWSKLLTDANNLTTSGLDIGLPGYQTSHPLNLERSVSPNDITNNFVGSAIWDIPFGHGQRFLGGAHGIVQQLVGGWQLSSIYTARSGYPPAFGNSGQATFAGSHPNFTGLPAVTQVGFTAGSRIFRKHRSSRWPRLSSRANDPCESGRRCRQ
jgi:hypothetical protein